MEWAGLQCGFQGKDEPLPPQNDFTGGFEGLHGPGDADAVSAD